MDPLSLNLSQDQIPMNWWRSTTHKTTLECIVREQKGRCHQDSSILTVCFQTKTFQELSIATLSHRWTRIILELRLYQIKQRTLMLWDLSLPKAYKIQCITSKTLPVPGLLQQLLSVCHRLQIVWSQPTLWTTCYRYKYRNRDIEVTTLDSPKYAEG